MKNNASDPVQQRVYDIYDHYKVTVVFNDTVGKVFVKQMCMEILSLLTNG